MVQACQPMEGTEQTGQCCGIRTSDCSPDQLMGTDAFDNLGVHSKDPYPQTPAPTNLMCGLQQGQQSRFPFLVPQKMEQDEREQTGLQQYRKLF